MRHVIRKQTLSYLLRLKGFFLGCVIGSALVTRLDFAGSIGLFGSMGGLADYASELSILVAIFAAARLTQRLNTYYDSRARRRVLEEGFVKWTAQLEARKSAAAGSSAQILKKVA
jgi:hypothetical protein